MACAFPTCRKGLPKNLTSPGGRERRPPLCVARPLCAVLCRGTPARVGGPDAAAILTRSFSNAAKAFVCSVAEDFSSGGHVAGDRGCACQVTNIVRFGGASVCPIKPMTNGNAMLLSFLSKI